MARCQVAQRSPERARNNHYMQRKQYEDLNDMGFREHGNECGGENSKRDLRTWRQGPPFQESGFAKKRKGAGRISNHWVEEGKILFLDKKCSLCS